MGALAIALYYLNLRSSVSWRRDLALPHESAARELSRGTGDLYGIGSAAELQRTLETFQSFGARLLELDPAVGPPSASTRVTLLKRLRQAAALTVNGFVLKHRTGQLAVNWGTQDDSCEQMLFGFLALALLEARFWPFAKCKACERFFAKPSRRAIRYCSARCRKRVQVARWRARQPPRSTRGSGHGQTRSMGIDEKTSS
jgi:hypothetical protein